MKLRYRPLALARSDWPVRTPLHTNTEQRRARESDDKKFTASRFPIRKALGEVNANCPGLYFFYASQRCSSVAGESWHFDPDAEGLLTGSLCPSFPARVQGFPPFFPQIHEAASWRLLANILQMCVIVGRWCPGFVFSCVHLGAWLRACWKLKVKGVKFGRTKQACFT